VRRVDVSNQCGGQNGSGGDASRTAAPIQSSDAADITMDPNAFGRRLVGIGSVLLGE